MTIVAGEQERRRALRREQHRRWRRRRNDIVAHRKAIYRARKRGAIGTHTLAEWRAKIAEYWGRCAYCGRADIELCRSRIVPPSRGGSNAISNVVPACRPCNSRRGARRR